MSKIKELMESLDASEELRHRAVSSVTAMNKVLRDEIAALKNVQPIRVFYSPDTEQLLASAYYDDKGITGPYTDVTSEIGGLVLEFNMESEKEVTEIEYEH